ncbi:MAG: hypothetical protein ACOY4H_06460 [Thermodesulfobacteriota bacterium]
MEGQFLVELWAELIWPLLRIVFLISAGLVAANFIEALNWAERLATLARPLIRYGRFSAVTGASFSLAFFSGVSANTMLAEAYDQGRMGKRELVLANLLNSLPRFFLHLPTVFFLTAPLIKGAAVAYVAITFSAALLLTLAVVLAGRFFLGGGCGAEAAPAAASSRTTARQALEKSVKRFRKRIRHILLFMVPVYVLFFFFGRFGVFARLEEMAARSWLLDWLNPKSVGIVILHVTAEFSAGVAAAGALLADNSLTRAEVVMALLVGNILAAPIRAARHQFPYYVGIFSPRLALELVGVSQAARIVCLVLVGLGYYAVIG